MVPCLSGCPDVATIILELDGLMSAHVLRCLTEVRGMLRLEKLYLLLLVILLWTLNRVLFSLVSRHVMRLLCLCYVLLISR